MTRRLFILSFLFAFWAGSALADEGDYLKAAEIESLLAGNTIEGIWGRSSYKQFFDKNGFTLYAPDNGRRDEGRWRVNADADTYESWWRSTGWTPYRIRREGETLLWVDGEGREYAFTVTEGRQITW